MKTVSKFDTSSADFIFGTNGGLSPTLDKLVLWCTSGVQDPAVLCPWLRHCAAVRVSRSASWFKGQSKAAPLPDFKLVKLFKINGVEKLVLNYFVAIALTPTEPLERAVSKSV